MLHLGTDEVPYEAWKGLGNSRTVFNNFVSQITTMGQDLGKQVVFWEEALKDGTPSKDAIIQVWLDSNMARRATENGNRVILSRDGISTTWMTHGIACTLAIR